MHSLKSYQESLEFIYGLRTSIIELRLDRVTLALALFDNPHNNFDVFHVAGTNGKGSTAAMLHQILSAGGYRAGLYTSPHLNSFTERIRVGDRHITESEVLGLVQEIAERTNAAGVCLTFFEFTTVLAFLYFARQGVDTAVIEVGLGGRLDATNVVQPVVSMVTSIALDHECFLGSNIGSIAREKAGIIKKGVPVVCGPLSPEAIEVVEDVAREQGARVCRWGREFTAVSGYGERLNYRGEYWELRGIEVGLRGLHQCRNAAVAIAALELAQHRFSIGESALRKGLKLVQWPGRLEVLSREAMIVLDGAHNVEGVRTLVSELPSVVGNRKVRLLFGSMSDKDWRTMLRLLCQVSSEIVLTRVPRPQSVAPAALREALPPQMGAEVIADPVEALSHLVSDVEKAHVPILVVGSLYLIGLVRGHVV